MGGTDLGEYDIVETCRLIEQPDLAPQRYFLRLPFVLVIQVRILTVCQMRVHISRRYDKFVHSEIVASTSRGIWPRESQELAQHICHDFSVFQ